MSASSRNSGARHCRTTLVALLIAVAAPQADAQRLADLPAGTRLRFQVDGSRDWTDATLSALTPDSVALQGPDRRFALARSQLLAVEQRAPDRSRARHVLIGAGFGTLVGMAAVAGDVRRCERAGRSECGIGYLLSPVVALAGALIGSTVGAVLPVERWRTVELP